MGDTIKYWQKLSDYELDTAIAMLKSKRYLYVGFMCHQTIEKIFKAYYEKLISEVPPISHSLSYLAKKGTFYELFSEDQKDLLTRLSLLTLKQGIHPIR